MATVYSMQLCIIVSYLSQVDKDEWKGRVQKTRFKEGQNPRRKRTAKKDGV
jgi:hypothetical protein